MKNFLLSFFVTGAFILYSIHQRGEDSQVAVVAPSQVQKPLTTDTPTPSLASPTPQNNPTSQPIPTADATPTPTSIPRGQYKDGQYTGDVADAFYGNIQVEVSIQNGKIADVQFLQYPNDRQTSIQINQQAMPYLRQEAIQAQNANVDIVGGATDSSQAFRESLASALGRAK